ncbi:hypothetical protein IFM89_004156 [Coptis chinensis]|uniref:Uncharacterized protein n=1 Tax=Coptis chinensis TaxID=261450 RepID=A0A835LDG8_9MAGN|nr:hypothetical protein IFM89_004156 [Coptis chinensis]
MNQNPEQHPRFPTCKHHPSEQFTGFCPSCLRERLNGLDPSNIPSTSSSSSSISTLHKSSCTIKSIFKGASSSGFLPELRRCKSFSGGRNESVLSLEPKRKSCDVRVRNTLWSLFNLDDERKGCLTDKEIEETRDLPVIQLKEEDEDEIRVLESLEDRIEEIVEEEEEIKTMKDHIDSEAQCRKTQGRDLKEIAGSFWLAASKKLQKWRRRQKMNKASNGGGGLSTMPKQKRIGGRQFRETQSEVADYGFGRRSCDTDPRYSLDAGRMSFDDPRCSWDEPRASWDGYLIGKMFPRVPPMVSVNEDVPVPVRRVDKEIPVELPMSSIIEDGTTPGGSAQTRDYYSDLSQRRRKSFDRSSSIGKATASMVADIDELRSISNAKVTPATSDYFHGAKVLVTECNMTDSKSNSIKDDRSESFESAFRDAASVVGDTPKESKKSSRWSKGWNIWGLIHRRSGRKNGDKERYCRRNGVDRSLSGSWPELRRDGNGKANESFDRKNFRSNSSVSSRRFSNTDGLLGSMRSSSVQTNGHIKKRREEFVLERNRSARYSPSSLDNGLLRFYLTPLRGSRRSNSGKSRNKTPHAIARSVLRLY